MPEPSPSPANATGASMQSRFPRLSRFASTVKRYASPAYRELASALSRAGDASWAEIQKRESAKLPKNVIDELAVNTRLAQLHDERATIAGLPEGSVKVYGNRLLDITLQRNAGGEQGILVDLPSGQGYRYSMGPRS